MDDPLQDLIRQAVEDGYSDDEIATAVSLYKRKHAGPVPSSEQQPIGEAGSGFLGIMKNVLAPQEHDAYPTAGGFMGNVLTSGANLVGNLAEGAVNTVSHPVETVQSILAMARQPGQTAERIRQALASRYGSYNNALATAYRDPVGMASDLSIAFGGASGAAKLARFGKTASALGAVSEVFNPLSIPSRLVSEGGKWLHREGTLTNTVSDEFPGAAEIGWQMNALPTKGGQTRVDRALSESHKTTLGHVQNAGARGATVDMADVAQKGLAESKGKAALRSTGLGLADETGDLVKREQAMSARGRIGVTEAQPLKTEAQHLSNTAYRAQQRGAVINDLDALSNKNVAAALRNAIEESGKSVGVTGIAESNKKTQALIGLAQALEDATGRTSTMSKLIGDVSAGRVPGVFEHFIRPTAAATGLVAGKVASPAMRQAQILRALKFIEDAKEQQP